jgi:hypothetical protein
MVSYSVDPTFWTDPTSLATFSHAAHSYLDGPRYLRTYL